MGYIRVLTTRFFEKRTMRRLGLLIGLAALLLVAALVVRTMATSPVVADDEDDDAFTNESIEGRWGFSAQGTILLPEPPGPIPAVAVGILDFDGAGGCVITDTANLGGTKIGPQTSVTCTYSVNPDGTGTFSVAFPGDPPGAEPAPISFVIVNEKKEIRTIRTDLGVATGVAKRQ